MKITFVLFVVLLLSSCVSNRDANEHGYNAMGGGYKVTKLGSDIYEVTVNSNFGPFVNYGSPSKVLNKQAKELCGDIMFELHNKRENHFESIPPFGEIPYITSQVKANVYCKGQHAESFSMVMKQLAKQQEIEIKNRQNSVVIDKQTVSGCVEGKIIDEAKLASEIENLKQAGRYEEVMNCHKKIITSSENKELIAQSLLDMSLMYELGLGVDIDLNKAKNLANLATQY
jgi:hypothetical protein